jgi:hypothetical protein
MKRFATTLRKPAFALLALAALTALATTASATTLMSDAFTYPNGNLVPNGTWANFSGAIVDIQVSGGRVTGSGPNANDDHRLFAAQPTTSKTYACFDVIIPTIPGAPKPIYFCMLKDAGTSIFVSRVYVLPITGGFTFGISNTSTTASIGVTPWSATTLLYDHKYNIVINYDPVNKSSTLWVDPATESSTSVTDVNATATAVGVAGFGLRQSATAATLPASPPYAGSADWGFSLDNLGVGTTFDDACTQYRSTPTTKSTWGAVKSIYR